MSKLEGLRELLRMDVSHLAHEIIALRLEIDDFKYGAGLPRQLEEARKRESAAYREGQIAMRERAAGIVNAEPFSHGGTIPRLIESIRTLEPTPRETESGK